MARLFLFLPCCPLIDARNNLAHVCFDCGRDWSSPAPKEQPPRKLSGKRTAIKPTLWKEDRLTGQVPPKEQPALSREISQVMRTEGARDSPQGVQSCRLVLKPGCVDGRNLGRSSQDHAAQRAPFGSRRPHGVVRRVCPPCAISIRHHGRAQMDPRTCRPVRCKPHGPEQPRVKQSHW